jgi:O-antigen/teichoic acid export membrane protein
MKIKLRHIQTRIQKIRQKGFFHLLSANILIQIVAFTSQLIVAGILAPEDIGRIKIIQTYLSIFSIVAGMGFNASTLKLCSENRTQEERDSLFRAGLLFTVISTTCIYLLILILNYLHIFTRDALIQWLIPLGLFPIVSNSLFSVITSYFQAANKIKTLSAITVSNKVVSIIGILILTCFWGIKGYYIAYNLGLILMLLACFKFLGFKRTKSVSSYKFSYFSTHWKYAKSSIWANLLSEMSAYVDIVLIGFFITDMHQIGFYSFALTITVLFRLFPSTVQQITNPHFSAISNQRERFHSVFKRYNKILYLAVALTFFIAWLTIPHITHFVFNGKYDDSMQYFPFLALGWSLRQLVQLQSAAIFGLGKIHYNALISFIVLLINTILISVLLHFYGLMGAAYASIPGGLAFVCLSRYYFHKALREMVE